MIQFKRIGRFAALATIPKIASKGDAGFDLYSLAIPGTFDVIPPGEYRCIPVGIACAIPDGWVGIVKPRSGLAVTYGVDIMAGVIDSSYRGEIRVLLRNDGDKPVKLNAGDRIAQMVVVPYMGEAVEVDELDDTARGAGGFGSTGQ